MTFAHPLAFALLALIPAFWAIKVWRNRRDEAAVAAWVGQRLRGRLAPPRRAGIGWAIFAAQMLGFALLAAALARPQWGYEERKTISEGRDIILAVDTSRSMLADDIEPNRLERVKLAAQDLIDALPAERIGLIAFAGRGFVQAPLTIDHEAVKETVRALDTEIIPRGGTNLAEALSLATDAFENAGGLSRALIIFSDGEGLEGETDTAAKKAADDGVTVVAVGVGTPGGAIIPDPEQPGEFIRDASGTVVRTRLDAASLQAIARSTGGVYTELAGGADLAEAVAGTLGRIEASQTEGATKKIPLERYQWPLGFGLLLLIGAHIARALANARPAPAQDAAPQAAVRPTNAASSSAAAAGIAALWLAGGAGQARAAAAEEAHDLFKRGEFAAAADAYRDEIGRKTNAFIEPELNFALGCAEYKAGDYEAAAEAFGSALLSDKDATQRDAHYNLGNTLFRLGEARREMPGETERLWTDAISEYETAAAMGSTQAERNKAVAEKRLEELKKQQEEQQKQNQQDEQNKGNEDQQDPKDQEQNQEGQEENGNEEQRQDPQNQPGDEPKGDPQQGESGEESQDPSQQPGGEQEQAQPQNQPGENESETGEDGQPSPEGEPQPGDEASGQEEGKEPKEGEPAGQGDKPEGEEGDGTGKPEAGEPMEPQEVPEGELQAAGEGENGNQGGEPQPISLADLVNEKTGFSPSQARALLRAFSDEDLKVRPLQQRRERGRFKDW